jgi:hypothetical protein
MVITGVPQANVIPHMRATLHALETTDPELALILRARMVLAGDI